MSDEKTSAEKAVVLLSGGMDSCVCAAMAIRLTVLQSVALLHASYGQRTERRERQAFEAIADFYGVTQRSSSSSITFAPSAVRPSPTQNIRSLKTSGAKHLPRQNSAEIP